MKKLNSTKILGVRIDKVTWSDIEEFCLEALNGTASHQIVTLHSEMILAAQNNQAFLEAINSSELVIPDSTNVVWVSVLRGDPLPALTPGSDLTVRLAKLAANHNKTVFLLGGWGSVPEKAQAALEQLAPGLRIVGRNDANPDDPSALAAVQQARPDIVFVAYGGSAKQELWIHENKEKTGAKILVGVGGTFDMLAGVLPRAPQWLRVLHLEWLWRLILQPRRFGRIWKALIVFPVKTIFSK